MELRTPQQLSKEIEQCEKEWDEKLATINKSFRCEAEIPSPRNGVDLQTLQMRCLQLRGIYERKLSLCRELEFSVVVFIPAAKQEL